MNGDTFKRLHGLRMENDEAGYRQADMRPRFDLLANRHENGTAPRAVVAHQLFQTPAHLAQQLVATARVLPRQTVLEPSAGLGRILDALPACTVTAVEIAATCAAELFRQDRTGVRIVQRDFLACTVAEFGPFDRVVMNPPFTMRADIRHILHAREFLKPGGRLAALCFNTPQREKALRPLCSTWEPIPAGAFGKEGTNVPTVLLTIDN